MSVVRLAAVQATYVLMDREATIDRVAQLTSSAAKEGAQVIVFPEVFVRGTPIWINTRPIWDGDGEWFWMLAENAVVIPSPAADRLGAIAREHEVWLVVGVEERERHGGTIYNTLVYFSPDGTLVERHRPTGAERTRRTHLFGRTTCPWRVSTCTHRVSTSGSPQPLRPATGGSRRSVTTNCR